MTGSVLLFCTLAYGITWVLVSPLVVQGLNGGSGDVSPLWHGLGALGPVSAAYWMRRAADPGVRVAELFRRQGPAVPRWVAAALVASPLVLAGLAVAGVASVRLHLGFDGLADALSTPTWVASVAVGSLAYGLGEEPGWRGWLLPRLQEGRSAVVATLILSLIWAGWHAPFFFYRFPFDGAVTVVGFFIAMLAGAFWLTFLFNSTGGSVWTVSLWHVTWNVVSQAALAMSLAVQAALNGLMIILGVLVVALWGRADLTVDIARVSNGFTPQRSSAR